MIEKFTISRNDEVYECFPSLTRLRNGRIVLVYRESDTHPSKNFTRIIIKTSDDDGRTWSSRRVLVATEVAGGVCQKYNCPKVQQLNDDQVLILCDTYPNPPGEASANPDYSHIEFWTSADNGESWDGPRAIGVYGIMPDEVIELDDGDCLLATHHKGVQYITRSKDGGNSWGEMETLARVKGMALCEASILRMPGGELVCYMRENTKRGLPHYKSISKDGGKTWEGPFETLMGAGHRPVAHLTQSGKVMITYRHYPGGAGPWAKNTFAFLETVESALEPNRAKQSGTVLPLGHDRNPKSDGGYTGWVETAPGEFLVMNYIKDDAPMAQIRGYRFKEADF